MLLPADLKQPEEAAKSGAGGHAIRRFGAPSHAPSWPRRLLDYFQLDAVPQAETELGTWLFGSPVLDYAIMQDKDALSVCRRQRCCRLVVD
eukprot:COSAG01_NODE_18035_length_1104_cov_1.546269_2_plen_91_part_01